MAIDLSHGQTEPDEKRWQQEQNQSVPKRVLLNGSSDECANHRRENNPPGRAAAEENETCDREKGIDRRRGVRQTVSESGRALCEQLTKRVPWPQHLQFSTKRGRKAAAPVRLHVASGFGGHTEPGDDCGNAGTRRPQNDSRLHCCSGQRSHSTRCGRLRSEERRVGKECRSRWSPCDENRGL